MDLATGTADVLISLLESSSNVKQGVGIDLAERMLKQGKMKVSKKGLDGKINLYPGDIQNIPFEDDSFDCVAIAFGIRNAADPKKVLLEMTRVLKRGGRALILEFSMADFFLIRSIQLFYLRVIVPAVGFLLTGHFAAYRYLNQTIETFPCGEDFCRMMKEAGFVNVTAHPLFFSAATIYQGDRE